MFIERQDPTDFPYIPDTMIKTSDCHTGLAMNPRNRA